ncbi:MAG: hypothetical protein M5R36_07730 [Deltaproteobacteria bacterium]|nr:hypothetical protein [Deltaproteobacteria bacterium]
MSFPGRPQTALGVARGVALESKKDLAPAHGIAGLHMDATNNTLGGGPDIGDAILIEFDDAGTGNPVADVGDAGDFDREAGGFFQGRPT